MLIKDELTSQR